MSTCRLESETADQRPCTYITKPFTDAKTTGCDHTMSIRVIQRSENTKTHSTKLRRTKKPPIRAPTTILHPPQDMKLDSTSPSGSSGMGYSRGGSQAGERTWRQQRRSWAVGRFEGDSSQHHTTNPHNLSERPNDLALAGLFGRFPFCTAITTTYGER